MITKKKSLKALSIILTVTLIVAMAPMTAFGAERGKAEQNDPFSAMYDSDEITRGQIEAALMGPGRPHSGSKLEAGKIADAYLSLSLGK